jgi:hypothetical protein
VAGQGSKAGAAAFGDRLIVLTKHVASMTASIGVLDFSGTATIVLAIVSFEWPSLKPHSYSGGSLERTMLTLCTSTNMPRDLFSAWLSRFFDWPQPNASGTVLYVHNNRTQSMVRVAHPERPPDFELTCKIRTDRKPIPLAPIINIDYRLREYLSCMFLTKRVQLHLFGSPVPFVPPVPEGAELLTSTDDPRVALHLCCCRRKGI